MFAANMTQPRAIIIFKLAEIQLDYTAHLEIFAVDISCSVLRSAQCAHLWLSCRRAEIPAVSLYYYTVEKNPHRPTLMLNISVN